MSQPRALVPGQVGQPVHGRDDEHGVPVVAAAQSVVMNPPDRGEVVDGAQRGRRGGRRGAVRIEVVGERGQEIDHPAAQDVDGADG